MIHEIRIDNFFSVRDEQILDFRVAGSAPEADRFRTGLAAPRTRAPTTVAVYGRNASGKSTLLRAITAAVDFALYSFSGLAPGAEIHFIAPFSKMENLRQPTRLSITFEAAWLIPSIYRYELVIGPADHSRRIVWKECLSYAPQGRMRRIFDRDKEGIYASRELGMGSDDARLLAVRPNASVISTLAALNHPFFGTVANDLNQLQRNVVGLGRLTVPTDTILQSYRDREALRSSLNDDLARLDTGLEGMEVVAGPSGPIARFRHTGLDMLVGYDQESQGTRHFIHLYPTLHRALERGLIAVIDDVDADLHPLLVREILGWFHSRNRNPYNAQIFFSAYDATLLDFLQKDEIVLTEKAMDGATSFYRASDIQGLRRDVSLSRKYLGGQLGAIPRFG